jgi:hypothetical protein
MGKIHFWIFANGVNQQSRFISAVWKVDQIDSRDSFSVVGNVKKIDD